MASPTDDKQVGLLARLGEYRPRVWAHAEVGRPSALDPPLKLGQSELHER
jgi:hypothetical protein